MASHFAKVENIKNVASMKSKIYEHFVKAFKNVNLLFPFTCW